MAEASIPVYLLNEQMNESFCNTVFVSLRKYSLGFFPTPLCGLLTS